MRGGTLRLPGRYVYRDGTMPGIPTCICVYSFYRILFMWTRDVFRPVSPLTRITQPGSRLERDDFCHINASSRLARDNIVLTLRYLQ